MQKLEYLKKTDDRFNLLNNEDMRAIDNINDSLMLGAINHLTRAGFKWIDVPILTRITGACENVNTLYEVDHFSKTAYLAQTGQLYLEAKIPLHEKVWTIIISSRAENGVDGRHLNQFQLVEFEHQGSFELLLENIQDTVQAMVKNVLDNNVDALEHVGRDLGHLESYMEDFNRISYTEAVESLKGTPLEIAWGGDLKHAHEKFLVEAHGNRPLFITHYPREIKFFNMRVNDENPNVVNSADLILPYSGEAVGSAERENDVHRLVERLKQSKMYKILSQKGVTLSEFAGYIKLVGENPILHSGCGIGFARVSQSVLGFDDIRMSTNYPINSESLY